MTSGACTRIGASLVAVGVAFGAAGACSPGPQGGGSGSNTSWLVGCDAPSDCAAPSECRCGLCVRACAQADDCGGLERAFCAGIDAGVGRGLCGDELGGGAPADDAPAGLCLPGCDDARPCAAGQRCVAGACLPQSILDASCGLGATLTLAADVAPLRARQGMLFGDAFYTPVAYDTEPASWTEPVTPAALVARVVAANGAPAAGCPLAWTTRAGGGWVYPDSAETDAAGEVRARWVAGSAPEQTLSVALGGAAGAVVSASLDGEARPHDAPPVAADAAAAVTRVAPTLAFLDFPLSPAAEAIEVELTPLTFPRETFYVATGLPGFFTGLQNVGALDAASDAIPGEERTLLASVWNVEEGDAALLWSDPEVVCAPHTQDLGGIRCNLAAAWALGEARTVTTELRRLASGEAAPAEYAGLGYAADPCTSAAGCTDLVVSLRLPDEPSPGRRVVAYRYMRAEVPASVSSYIDVFSASDGQATSCLALASRQVLVSAAERVSGVLAPVSAADFGAVYASWQNRVCANYGAERQGAEILLVTGGTEALGRPLLPGEDLRRLP